MWIPQLVICPCGEMFEQRIWGQKYCRPEHRGRGARRDRSQLSAARRGYDYQHQMKRKAALAALKPADPCPRCGDGMWPEQKLHLDHADDDRNIYLGLSHARCNLSAGAARGNKLRARRWWQCQRTQLTLFRPPKPKKARPLVMRTCACGRDFPAKHAAKSTRCQDCRIAVAVRAAEMRRQGHEWREIASTLGFSGPGSVYTMAVKLGGLQEGSAA